jgi:hypothetical protein
MAFIRQYVAPLIAVLIFLVALAAVSARIFLPDDMAAPAPIEAVSPQNQHAQILPSEMIKVIN